VLHYGLPHPNRLWSDATKSYRFGFNGVEKENTTYDNGTAGSGEGKMLAMDFRMYDARLGRWWGQDPIVHPWESPYVGMGNNPVNFADPLGLMPGGGETGGAGDGSDYLQMDANGQVTIDQTKTQGTNQTATATVSIVTGNTHVETSRTISMETALSMSPLEARHYKVRTPPTGTISQHQDTGNEILSEHWQALNHNLFTGALLGKTSDERQASLSLYFLSSGTYSTLDGSLIAMTNVAHKTGFNPVPAHHLNNEFANDKEIFNANMSMLINLFPAGVKGLGAATAKLALSPGTAVAEAAEVSEVVVATEAAAIVKYYPENDGAVGDWTSTFLMPGDEIDRLGHNFGKYFSPRGTPKTMRALPPDNTGPYNAYKVLKPFEVRSSVIAPAYGDMGFGIQYLAPVNVNTLLKRGIIAPINGAVMPP